MSYKAEIALTGHSGFLGSSLASALEFEGATIKRLQGDTRDPATFEQMSYDTEYLFHFGAPSSQVLFNRQRDYCVDVTINGFRNALRACEQHGIKLIYPSTGLLSHGETNEYARAKQVTEDLAAKAKCDILGLRIFGTYGPGEGAKKDYASVPYLFLRDMLQDRQPIIFGDGEQKRDFIYIEDTIKSVLAVSDKLSSQIVDIGSGQSYTFNEIVGYINGLLSTEIKPQYVEKPAEYINATDADISVLSRYYQPGIVMKEGLKRIIESERK